MDARPAMIPAADAPRLRSALTATRPAAYAALLVAAAVAALIYALRTDGVFACPAGGYSSDRYLAYCNALHYGEYEHGALWFEDLDPEARRFAAGAAVLFLGNSRMQYAFSTRSTEAWFAQQQTPYVLLGFSYYENGVFAQSLLDRLKPKPRMVVINVDRFFEAWESEPAKALLHGKASRTDYAAKRRWQEVHRGLCAALPALCGDHYAMYRSRRNGSWEMVGTGPFRARPVTEGPAADKERWPDFVEFARQFVDRLPVSRDCVLFTLVPTVDTRRDEAAHIAAALGIDLIAPQVDALRTFDGSHLDAASAERWSQVFFRDAGSRLGECLRPREG